MSSHFLPWLLYVAIGAGALTILLLYTQRAKTPSQFSNLPVYQFFTLSTLVVCFILAVSFFPNDLFGNTFPISTMQFVNPENKTQWVLNIGGTRENVEDSLGLQIPLYVVVAGILGAYIRYLYIDIKQFKNSYRDQLINFDERYHDVQKTQYNYSRFVGRKFISLDDEINTKDEDIYPGARAKFSNDKQQFLNEITKAGIESDKERFRVRFELSNNTLSTVGFFLLAPLLAILAWLILVISGTDNPWTFAFVSLSVGLTTTQIVNRVRKLFGDLMQQPKPGEEPEVTYRNDGSPIR